MYIKKAILKQLYFPMLAYSRLGKIIVDVQMLINTIQLVN